jgi:DNA repair exonuclease SbcCD nuclease subunit
VKVVVVSDLHPDVSTAGFPRFDDVQAALDQAVEYAIQNDAVFFFLGDLVTNDPPNDVMIRCIGMAQRAAHHLAAAGLLSCWIAGNHDVFEDGLGTTALDPLERTGCVRDGERIGRVIVSKSEPMVIQIGLLKLAVTFPFAPTSHGYDPLAEARKIADRDRVVLVGSHLMLEGIGPGSETQDFPRGRDLFLPIDEIRQLFPNAVIVSGHYHTRELYRGVQVVGSLVRLTRGERHDEPGFLVLEV